MVATHFLFICFFFISLLLFYLPFQVDAEKKKEKKCRNCRNLQKLWEFAEIPENCNITRTLWTQYELKSFPEWLRVACHTRLPRPSERLGFGWGGTSSFPGEGGGMASVDSGRWPPSRALRTGPLAGGQAVCPPHWPSSTSVLARGGISGESRGDPCLVAGHARNLRAQLERAFHRAAFQGPRGQLPDPPPGP